MITLMMLLRWEGALPITIQMKLYNADMIYMNVLYVDSVNGPDAPIS